MHLTWSSSATDLDVFAFGQPFAASTLDEPDDFRGAREALGGDEWMTVRVDSDSKILLWVGGREKPGEANVSYQLTLCARSVPESQ